MGGLYFRKAVQAHLDRLTTNECRNEQTPLGKQIRKAIELLEKAKRLSFEQKHYEAEYALREALEETV